MLLSLLLYKCYVCYTIILLEISQNRDLNTIFRFTCIQFKLGLKNISDFYVYLIWRYHEKCGLKETIHEYKQMEKKDRHRDTYNNFYLLCTVQAL